MRPLVSCLCVTEDRSSFMPWLLWSFDRQSWPAKELVIVDSSAVPFALESRVDVRVLHAPRGATVATKRNQALAAARGTAVAWFDDDDWQHTQRLETLVDALNAGVEMAGPKMAWMVDIFGERAWEYPGFDGAILFNGSGFLIEAARSVAFETRRRRASDTVWLSALARARGATCPPKPTAPTFFWLYHGMNLSVSPKKRKLRELLRPTELARVRASVGPDAWGDTDVQLDDLRARLLARR